MIVSGIESLRDPFIVVENGVYYAYGTAITNGDWDNCKWGCYKNTSGRLDGEWVMTDHLVYEKPEYAAKNFWAPEVHKHNGAFYMFTTYYSSHTNHRGVTILKAEHPEGPFVEITNGHITPADWDAIDGTLYIDEEGQPWLIFVKEWTCTEEKVGRMAAAKLSQDFTHLISEPIILFRADDPEWTDAGVTDGCFMYKTADGQLLMLWSNNCDCGYCVGIARSDNGKVDGNWIHDKELLYSAELANDYDGGHGMIFYDLDGKMHLSIHSPNFPNGECHERTVFLPLREENGTLRCEW